MSKVCDHTSVGMLVWREGKLLIIERKKAPLGFAVPAGHVDGDSTFEEAAKRELKEEVGLDAHRLEIMFDGRKENPCRREGGIWHHWKIYKVEATGDVKRSEEETKQAGWYSVEELRAMYDKIEPIWQELFKELKIL